MNRCGRGFVKLSWIELQVGLKGSRRIAGTGLAFISYEYEQSSPTDSSLGTSLPGGGSMFTEEGGTGGVIFDVGIGYTFSSPFDLRFEVPIMIPFGIENVSVVPLFMLTAGYRF